MRGDRPLICPRCLTEVGRGSVTYQTLNGERVSPPRLRRPPKVGDWARSLLEGDPERLEVADARSVAEHYARGIAPVCPRGHRLPQAMFDRDSLLVALVGERSSGKSVYLASLINELVAKGALHRLGLSFRLDESCRRRFGEEFGSFVDTARVPMGTDRNSDSAASREPYVVVARLGGVDVVNLVIFDVAGEQLGSMQAQAEHSRHLVVADVALFFVPPAAIPGIAGRGRDDQLQTRTRTAAMVADAIGLLSQTKSSGQSRAGAIVVSKADDIPTEAFGQMEDILSDPDYADLDDALERLDAEEVVVRSFLEEYGAGSLVRELVDYFQHTSYHLVSCVEGPKVDGVFTGGLHPCRVPDPILFVLDAAGLLTPRPLWARRRRVGG